MRKILGYGIVGIVALGITGAAIGGNYSKAKNEPAAMAGRITGKVRGVFRRNCLLCDQRLERFVKTGYVWCAWQDGKVLIHVTMRNTSAEHITVNWHPSYVIARGGEHGKGLSSVESNGFDAGERRSLIAKEDPKGVKDRARIAVCKPSFQLIESG